VGTVARLVPQKAPEDFVAACALVARSVPLAEFVLIGSGPLEPQLRAAVAREGIAARFHHVLGLERAAAALGDLDVFLLTSQFEGGPYAPLEAMRAGTPVVVSDAVGSRDTVEDGRSGLIVPVGDVAGYASAVTALLQDPRRGETLAEQARIRLRERFDVRSMGRAHDELYEGLVR
jgi:glycosyltransferase involved in cell wall biosynthesis